MFIIEFAELIEDGIRVICLFMIKNKAWMLGSASNLITLRPHTFMNRIISSFTFIFFCLFSLCVKSQTAVTDTGKIEVVQDYKIKELLSKHSEVNSKSNLKGYRIKIHFGSDKTKAREVKSKFILRFPDVPAYEKYDQPNFNIRVGDFRTKLDAYRFLKEVQAEFPSAFIVQDDIELPKIE